MYMHTYIYECINLFVDMYQNISEAKQHLYVQKIPLQLAKHFSVVYSQVSVYVYGCWRTSRLLDTRQF